MMESHDGAGEAGEAPVLVPDDGLDDGAGGGVAQGVHLGGVVSPHGIWRGW